MDLSPPSYDGIFVQLLNCANIHSQGSLPVSNEDYQALSGLATISVPKNVDQRKDELNALFKVLKERLRAAFMCSQVDVVSKRCKRKKCNAELASMGPKDLSYLVYKDNNKFTSSEEFSSQWEKSLEQYCKCYHCEEGNHIPISFRNWPRYLFVCCINGSKLLNCALAFPFTIGKSVKATYSLIGAVLSERKKFKSVPRTVIVKIGEEWLVCSDKSKHKDADMKELGKMEVDYLLFAQDNFHGNDVALQAHPLPLQPKQVGEKKRVLADQSHNTPRKHPARSVQIPHSPQPVKVLRLPNQGNSCWIASCCQLLYCAHSHSDHQLLNFSGDAPPLIKHLHTLMAGGNRLKTAWEDFYVTLFKEIPELKSYEFDQGDVGQFYEWLMTYVALYLTEHTKKQFFCTDIEHVRKGCKCNHKPETERAEVLVLQYSGPEKFRNSHEFSEAWRTCFENESACDKCSKVIKNKNYYTYMPQYLFVLTSSSIELFKTALEFNFTIGSRNSETYQMIGAAVHTGTNSGGHYVALIKCGEQWYECDDEASELLNLRKLKGDIQLLLFRKISPKKKHNKKDEDKSAHRMSYKK